MPMTPDEVVKIISSLDIDCTNPTTISQEIVTHEMALDAQDPQLEGQIIRDESYERCGACPNCMFNQVKAEIITDLQDYQKLREKIDADKIRGVMGVNCESYPADEYKMANAIVTYLQQPTEH